MKPFEQQTYYELLEIPVTAPDAEVRAAYERALETYSPDSVAVYTLVEPGQVDALRARLTEAMEILTDSDLRAEYDRMIGVKRAEPGVVAAMAPALAAAAQSVEPQAKPALKEAPAAAPVAEKAPVPAPEPVAQAAPAATVAPAASEALTPPAASPTEVAAPSAAPAPAAAPVPPGQIVMPGGVTPSQIHAAFSSYAISYVPVLVPAPSLNPGSAFFSPFTPPAQTDAPAPAPESPHETKPAAPTTPAAAPAPETVAVQAPTPAAEPVSPPAATPTGAAEAASRSTSSSAPAPSTAAEPAPAAATPAAATPPAAAAPTPVEPSHSREPTPPAAAAAEQPAPARTPQSEKEPSETRAPAPSNEDARAASGKPRTTPPPLQPGRSGRTFNTPPPLPHGGRRSSTPAPLPGGEAGRGSARAQAGGMNLEEAQQIAQESAIATAEAALAQVAAKAREPRPKPIELPPNTEFNGELLRRVRESRNLSLVQLGERTRISTKHLENVEADRYSALPATVYLRGILMNIARELGLDPLRVSRSYLALAAIPKKK